MSLAPKDTRISKLRAYLKKAWRPQGDSNPCCRRERPVSLAGLDDGDTPNLDYGIQGAEFLLIYSKIQIPKYNTYLKAP